MLIRAPLTTEVFDLCALLTRLHPLTRFAGLIDVDEKYARGLLAQMIQRNDGLHDGGAFIRVCESEGRIVGFIAGMLDRVYHVYDRLWAQDVFFIMEPDAPLRASGALLGAYIEWARKNPKVYEIHLSHLDALPNQDRLDRHYESRGFMRCGSVFRLTKGEEASS